MIVYSLQFSPNEDLPRSICEFCKSKLLVAYQFAQEVVENQEKLSKEFSDLFSDLVTKNVEEIEIIVPEDTIPTPSPSKSIKIPNKPSLVSNFPKKPKKPLHLEKSIKSEKTVSNGKTIYKKECPICHTLQQNLKQHLIVHSGVRKHKCQVCNKTFSQVSNLNNHMKLHDPENAKERLKCDQCETTFTDPRSLKRHEAKHSGERKYKCDICPKGFLYSHNLLNHKRSHLQDKRYKCEEKGCDKAFVTCGELKRHVNWHKKERNKKIK